MLPTQRERPVPLSDGPAAPHMALNQTVFTFLPVLEIIQTSQLHPPIGTERHLILLLLQKLPLRAAVFHSVPEFSPQVSLQGIQYPLLG